MGAGPGRRLIPAELGRERTRRVIDAGLGAHFGSGLGEVALVSGLRSGRQVFVAFAVAHIVDHAV